MKIATFNVNGVNGRLTRLLEWLDEIALALQRSDAIDRYEAERDRHGPPVPVTTAL